MSTSHVQQTSIWSFWQLQNLGARQRQVYNAIDRLGPVSNLDIAEALRMPINSITPRTNELVAKGLVQESYKAPSRQTGKTVIYWRAA